MKIPQQRRILKEDLPDAPSWVSKIISPINNFMETMINGLNKRLTFQENIASDIRELSFSTLNSYSSGNFTPIQYQYAPGTAFKVQGIIILQVLDVTNATFTPIQQAVSLDWYESNGVVYIAYISGLQDSKSYKIRILTF